MFERTRMPVTVFKSSDAGAPPAYSDNGFVDVYAVLKACLVDGYGEKKSLGWAAKFDDAAKKSAHFVSQHSKCNGWGFSVVHDLKGIYTKISMFRDAETLNTGSLAGSRFVYLTGNNNYTEQSNWMLVGNALGFVLLVSPFSGAQVEMLYFSQCPSLAAGDAHNTICICSSHYNSVTQETSTVSSGSFYSYPRVCPAASYYGYLGSDYVYISRFSASNLKQGQAGKISNAALFDEIFICEATDSVYDLRMVAPGILIGNIAHSKNNIIDLNGGLIAKLNGVDDFLISSSSSSSSSSFSFFSSYAVNLMAWEM